MNRLAVCLVGLALCVGGCGGSGDWEDDGYEVDDPTTEVEPEEPPSDGPGSVPPGPGIPDLCAGALCNAPESVYDTHGRPPEKVLQPIIVDRVAAPTAAY